MRTHRVPSKLTIFADSNMLSDPETNEDKHVEVPVTAAAPHAPPPPSASGTANPAGAAVVAASAVIVAAESLDFGSLSLITAFFAFVVMIQSSIVCTKASPSPCIEIRAYQVAVGVVSGCLGLLAFILNIRNKVDGNIALAFGIFQFLWWVAGVIVLTFFGDVR